MPRPEINRLITFVRKRFNEYAWRMRVVENDEKDSDSGNNCGVPFVGSMG